LIFYGVLGALEGARSCLQSARLCTLSRLRKPLFWPLYAPNQA